MRQYISDLKYKNTHSGHKYYECLRDYTADKIWCDFFMVPCHHFLISQTSCTKLISLLAVPGLSYHSVEFSWNKDPKQIQHKRKSHESRGSLTL